MQPWRPHGHFAPSSLTTTWPISPAPPRPSHCLPSRMIPPPTPVPQKTPISDSYGLPAPSWNSASVATADVVAELHDGVRASSARAAPSSKGSSQSGRLPARATVPAFASMSPGEPAPTPASADASTPASSIASRSAPAISFATSGGPPSVGVARLADPRTFESASTTTVWILVPPRSMPPRSCLPSWPCEQPSLAPR